MRKVIFILVALALASCTKDEKVLFGVLDSYTFHSQFIKDEFTIYTYLPTSTLDENPNVLIQLDGDSQFHNTVAEVEHLLSKRSINPVVVVGIGYPEGNKRVRDYTMSSVSGEGGEADLFYRFLSEELKDNLIDRLKLNPNARFSIKGHSLGGLFVTYALLTNEKNASCFSNFIAQSPSLWWNGGEIFQIEESAESNSAKGSFYMCVGGLEGFSMNSLASEMHKRLLGSKYPSLSVKFDYLEREGHSSSKFKNYSSLEFIYRK